MSKGTRRYATGGFIAKASVAVGEGGCTLQLPIARRGVHVEINASALTAVDVAKAVAAEVARSR